MEHPLKALSSAMVAETSIAIVRLKIELSENTRMIATSREAIRDSLLTLSDALGPHPRRGL